MIHEADVWSDDEKEARGQIGQSLSPEHNGLICVSVSREEDHPIAQAPPPPIEDPKRPGRPIQQPAPPPLPGKVRWRMHYESKP